MNNQEAFDTVVKHLRAQGKKSIIEYDDINQKACMYRGPNGTKCAAGILISDEEYHPWMENLGISFVRQESFGIHVVPLTLRQKLQDVSEELLYDLQKCHDRVAVEDWETQLHVIADRYSLAFPPKEQP